MSSGRSYTVPTVEDFSLVTTSELRTWNVQDIITYSTVISNVIAIQTARIEDNQVKVAKYESELVETETQLKSIERSILANNNAIISYKMRYADNLTFNENLESSISGHNLVVAELDSEISMYDDLIKDIDTKLTEINVNGDITYNAAAAYYSTFIFSSLVADKLYENCLYSTTLLSTLYESSIISEQSSLVYLQLCADDVLSTTMELSTLYTEGVALHSTLTEHRLEEILYTYAYASTTAGLLQASTLYDTAVMFSSYTTLLSSHANTVAQYNLALDNYTFAAQNPNTTLSGATAAGWGVLMSSLSAKDADLQRQILMTSNNINTQIVNSQMLWIQASDVAVDIGSQTISSLALHMDVAETNMKYYSSMYDDANVIVESSMNAYLLYNSYYVSTVGASNANMNNIMKTISTYGNDQTGIDEITARVQVLQDQYTALTSSYMGNIAYSTTMGLQQIDAINEFNIYSTLYESTNNALVEFHRELTENESTIYGTIGELNTESTIMDIEEINMSILNTELSRAAVHKQIHSCGFREAYVVKKRMIAQDYYDSTIISKVNEVNIINKGQPNDLLQSVDVTTADIDLAYTNLDVIQQFLDTFDSVYSSYDNYMSGLLNLSTSLNDKLCSYSTLASYRTLRYIYPNDTTFPDIVTSSLSNYESADLDSLQKVQDLVPSNSGLDIISSDFYTRYTKVFDPIEIIDLESTTVSIIKEGYDSFTGDLSSDIVIPNRKYFIDSQIKPPDLDLPVSREEIERYRIIRRTKEREIAQTTEQEAEREKQAARTPEQEAEREKQAAATRTDVTGHTKAALPTDLTGHTRELLVARTPEQEAATRTDVTGHTKAALPTDLTGNTRELLVARTPEQEAARNAGMPAQVTGHTREALVARTPEQEAARNAGMPTP